MAKNVLQRHWDGEKFEEIHPVTKASNVYTPDGKSIEQVVDEHKADEMPHQYTSDADNKTYRWGLGEDGRGIYFIREEVI
ncbi:hypothetical protein BTR22_19270 [Alkalihalophilus pseudofirmus]|uniref:hypothetical protein n=1 Tax=Alkalihalophilus pseudofirmus TaxID=79885 RepID=UPI000952275F|nr:hypothetical protein BTR22_19270 [Alkalihalophilus pseudofirmus]